MNERTYYKILIILATLCVITLTMSIYLTLEYPTKHLDQKINKALQYTIFIPEFKSSYEPKVKMTKA